jgi:hypothetical protein
MKGRSLLLAGLVSLTTVRSAAGEFAGPHEYRAGDAVVSYVIPRELVSAFTRVEPRFKNATDTIIFTTAYRSQGFFVETPHGNFTMAVNPTPEGLRPDRSVKALNDYYSLFLSTELKFVETSVKESGGRQWLHVLTRPRSDPEKISSVLYYTEISPDFILYIGIGSGTSKPFRTDLLRKFAPLVEHVVASVRIERVNQAAANPVDGSRPPTK